MTSDAPSGTTPSQTVGPFFAYVLTPKDYGYPEIAHADIATSDAAGDPIRLEGRVFDEDGQPVPDAMVEIWQADGDGRYATGQDRANSGFTGFGRCQCDPQGGYSFSTVKPGKTPLDAGGQQAPHVNLGLFARGLLKRLFTRIYFADEDANETDPILRLVPDDRRATLIARREDRDGEAVYVLDIHLRGEGETVFFEA